MTHMQKNYDSYSLRDLLPLNKLHKQKLPTSGIEDRKTAEMIRNSL